MTQKEFDELPGLLTRKQFMAVTGLQSRQVDELRKSREIGVWRPFKRGAYGKYYKADAGRMAGYQLR